MTPVTVDKIYTPTTHHTYSKNMDSTLTSTSTTSAQPEDADNTTVHTADIARTAAAMKVTPDSSSPIHGALCLIDRLEEGRCRREAFFYHTGKKSGWCS
jgi:hypothetical protein